MRTINMIAVIVLSILFLAGEVSAKTIRATELNGSLLSQIQRGTADDLIVEFRQGDELPVSFAAEGDLIESSRIETSYVKVKRNFWIRVQQSRVQMSLDGNAYRDFSELATGSFEAGAGSDNNGGLANALQMKLKAFLK